MISLFNFTSNFYAKGKDDPASKILYCNNPSSVHYIQADDSKIYYEIYRKGEPIIAMIGCPYELCQLIDYFSKYYLVISQPARGNGKSEIGTKKKKKYKQKATDVYDCCQ